MNKHDREVMAAFFAQVGENGNLNGEKAETRHHVIRRIETTSKDKSYEDADESIDNRADGLPIGVVDQDNSATSRGLIRNLDAMQNSRVIYRFANITEARNAMQEGKVYAYI